MLNTHKLNTQSSKQVYQIRLEGHLDDGWTDWFEGTCVKGTENTNTLLTCTVTDQAELFGLLRKVRDLSVPLLSVTRVKPDPTASLDLTEIQASKGEMK